MLRSTGILAAFVGVLVVSLAGQALAQSRPAGPGGMWGGPGAQMDPEQMKKMMEQFKKQAEKYVQDALGATDEEWTVLSPKVEKVQTLTMQTMAFGGRMGSFLQPADDAQKPDVTKKLESLRKLLQNKEAKAEDINTALKEYRDARAKAKEDLEKAQKELKDVLTARQEALMVTMGMLP